MKQQSFFKAQKFTREHGGALSLRKRRSRRPLSTQEPLHLTLRSDLAFGPRSLLRHRPHIDRVLKKASLRFHVRVYEKAICGNHLHLLVHCRRRENLQNFFRVVAGHIAQGIVFQFPILATEQRAVASRGAGAKVAGRRGGAPRKREAHPKNQRKFWALLLYSRVLTWGREFNTVKKYVVQNTLEALHLIAYKPRSTTRRSISIGTNSS